MLKTAALVILFVILELRRNGVSGVFRSAPLSCT